MSTLTTWLPPFISILITVALVMIPISLGQRLGGRARRRSEGIGDAPIGSVVGASLGLLAFMLAFTFQIVANRYDTRKELLLEDITTIRGTYLRASLLPEPYRSEAQKLLVEWVDMRVNLVRDPALVGQTLKRGEEIYQALWRISERLSVENNSSEVYALFISSVNDLVDLFHQRITITLQYRIPVAIKSILYLISFFSMLILGYQFGISGKSSFIINLALALTFGCVMWLIAALDHPETGMIKLNQAPLFELQEQLHRYQQ